MVSLIQKIKKADYAYDMIQNNDKIAVGMSGGKDSNLLFLALHEYRKISPKNFEIIGIHIKLGFKELDFSQVQNFFAHLESPIHAFESNIAKILYQHEKNAHLSCSLCSRLKKGQVVKEALALGCTKIAFAHHADDAIETLFMNMIHGGRIASFEPVSHLSRQNIVLIRPLIQVFEHQIIEASKQLKLPIIPSHCPNDKHTEREAMKHLLNKLYQDYDKAHQSFLTMLSNQKQLKLWTASDKDMDETQ